MTTLLNSTITPKMPSLTCLNVKKLLGRPYRCVYVCVFVIF